MRVFTAFNNNYPAVLYNAPFIIKDQKGRNTGLSTIFAERIIIDQYATLRPEGMPAYVTPSIAGYEKAAYIQSFTHATSITHAVRVGGREAQIADPLKALIQAPMNKCELDLGLRFAFSTATSYTDASGNTVDCTMGDGLAMLSASHTLTGIGTTWSNINPANPAFSKSALSAAFKIGQRNTYDNFGKNQPVLFDTILSTDDQDTCVAIRELTNATADINTSNSGTYNVYANIKHIVAPRICMDALGQRDTTKEKYWFLIDSRLPSFYLSVLIPPYLNTPTVGSNGEDFLSGSLNFLAGMDYGIAVVSPRGSVGSTGLGV